MTRRCFTPEEFAISRRVSVQTVYRHIHSGKFGNDLERVGRQYRIWARYDPLDTSDQKTTKNHQETHEDSSLT